MAVTVNLALLVFFKYLAPLVEGMEAVFSVNMHFRELKVPIGISVYVLQAIGYLVDIYRGKIKAQRRLWDFALYLSMFPQMCSGLIVRYSDLDWQIRERNFNLTRFGDGVMYFIRGLAKTVLIANTVGDAFEQIMMAEPEMLSMMTGWLGCMLFGFRIYFDLSGYADMAIGLGQMFGFRLRKNFEYPYTAQSIAEFWRRWHLSLTAWFQEYVYAPLGGDENGTAQTVQNVLIVWGLIGFWYGASWHFLAWGLYFGVLLLLERYVWKDALLKLSSIFRRIYAMALIFIGWIFFFSPDMGYAMRYLGTIFGIGASGLLDHQTIYLILTNWGAILLAVVSSGTLGYELLQRMMYNMRKQTVRPVVACVVYGILFLLTIAFLELDMFTPFFYL